MITKIATQGRFGNGMGVEFAETFWLHYTRDGVNWMQWRNKYGEYVSQPQQMRSDDSQHNSASFFVCNFGHTRHFSHDLTPLLCYFFCTLLTPASVSHYLDKCSNSSSNHINDHVCLWSLMKQCGHFSILPALTVLHHFETIYILVVRSFCKLATLLSVQLPLLLLSILFERARPN